MLSTDGQEREEQMKFSEEKGAAQRVLLLVLLLVVVLFGYLYFFTGMIKPREEETRPPAPPAPMTKKPIPPRPGKEEAGKGSAAVPANTPLPSSALPETGKTAVEQPKPAPKGKPEVSKAQVAPQVKPDAVKAAPATPATAKKVPPAASAAVKEKQAAKPQKKAAATTVAQAKMSSAGKKQRPRYILVGEYIVEADLKKAERQLKKAGSTFAVTTVKKAEPMHRLHVADFARRADAEVELKKVQKFSGSAFVLPAKDKFSLYAGSYFREQQAAKEKERLGGKGVAVTLEKTEVAIPVKRLSTGAFCTKEQAETEAARLRKAGIKASVVPVGK